ncbi:N-acyl-D-glucosamine 2-epimerase [Paenibacillus thermotolerans]|uniref:N-acyl-D-glucosamine 2-epimerase n=1 Tax=Paenibacillus thermotolerans TaxID=3027807 RepID=UPI0023680410|nr:MULTISPECIES: N-acyl-D-glucosamine 2-epimerase [unclassified Paenibacillus]
MDKRHALYGPSIQVDPLFPYYLNRSCDSIADEIAVSGYGSVHYFVVNENIVNGELIEAFRRRGIAVWAMVLGNGTFSTERFPADWPSWQMELLQETNDGFTRFSHFCSEYAEWKKAAMARLVSDYPFDGIEIAEPYFPEWDGIERGVYGDVGPHARRRFMEIYGLPIPHFRDTQSPNYYKTNKELYAKWVEFRVDAVNGFIDEMINGKGGVREARPDILVATWSLAIDAGPDSASLLREHQGLDAPSMVAKVRPDIHYFQTHWPDWIKGEADLPPNYIERYKPFADAVRAMHPSLPLAVQADIGSSTAMIKSAEWLRAFQSHAHRLGFASWTAYEYHIGGYMYEEPPVPRFAERHGTNGIIVSFSKRIDPKSAESAGSYVLPKLPRGIGIESVKVDGNRLILNMNGLPKHPFEIEFAGITDTPPLWLYYKDREPNRIPPGLKVIVP